LGDQNKTIFIAVSGASLKDGFPEIFQNIVALNMIEEGAYVERFAFHLGINDLVQPKDFDTPKECQSVPKWSDTAVDSFRSMLENLVQVYPEAEFIYLGSSSIRKLRTPGDFYTEEVTPKKLKIKNNDISTFHRKIRKLSTNKAFQSSTPFLYCNVLSGLVDSEVKDVYGHLNSCALVQYFRRIEGIFSRVGFLNLYGR
jgi:hypothetical protein